MDTTIETAPAELQFAVSGMTCASCVARVEKALKKVPGVTDASVNLATEKAQVTAVGVPLAALIAAVGKAGADVAAAGGDAVREKPAGGLPAWWPVAAAALLSVPLLVPMLA